MKAIEEAIKLGSHPHSFRETIKSLTHQQKQMAKGHAFKQQAIESHMRELRKDNPEVPIRERNQLKERSTDIIEAWITSLRDPVSGEHINTRVKKTIEPDTEDLDIKVQEENLNHLMHEDLDSISKQEIVYKTN